MVCCQQILTVDGVEYADSIKHRTPFTAANGYSIFSMPVLYILQLFCPFVSDTHALCPDVLIHH